MVGFRGIAVAYASRHKGRRSLLGTKAMRAREQTHSSPSRGRCGVEGPNVIYEYKDESVPRTSVWISLNLDA